MFLTQQSALQKIKAEVERVYRNGRFTNRRDVTECCNVVNLTENYEFGLPVSTLVLQIYKLYINTYKLISGSFKDFFINYAPSNL